MLWRCSPYRFDQALPTSPLVLSIHLHLQVKNFGRSGRTKYTHLVDQDTTSYDSAWTAETGQNLKFHSTKGGGLKQSFEKPKLSHKK